MRGFASAVANIPQQAALLVVTVEPMPSEYLAMVYTFALKLRLKLLLKVSVNVFAGTSRLIHSALQKVVPAVELRLNFVSGAAEVGEVKVTPDGTPVSDVVSIG